MTQPKGGVAGGVENTAEAVVAQSNGPVAHQVAYDVADDYAKVVYKGIEQDGQGGMTSKQKQEVGSMRGVHTEKTKQLELSEEYPFTYSITTGESSDGRATSAHAECYFKAKDLESRFVITYAFDPRVLVRTILGECGELPLLVCSHCGNPNCLDITRQRLSRNGEYIELEIEQSECRRFFRFREDGYVQGAVFVLLEAYEEKLGWDFYSGCFKGYEDYKQFIDGFLGNPEFAALWKVEMEMHKSMKEFESREQSIDR